MKKFLAVGVLILLPSLLLGVYPEVALGAGFAKQSIFLSRSSVTEGDTVRIHATVSNDAASSFTGNVMLLDGTASIGSVSVTLAAGAAQAISANWAPTAGEHTITAKLQTQSGAVIQETSATFTVAAKPAPAPNLPASRQGLQTGTTNATGLTAATVDSSQGIQNQIGSYSPMVARGSEPIFAALDNFRTSAASFLDGQINSAKQHLATTPSTTISQGTIGQNPTIPSGSGGFWSIVYTLYLYVLTLVRFLVGSAAVFYPLFVVVFFFILWRIYRRIRR
jgi:hypothetical protein